MFARLARVLVLFAAVVFPSAARKPSSDDVIIVYPGKVKSVPGPKDEPKTRKKRRTPRVGTRKKEARLSRVRIEPLAAKSTVSREASDGESGNRDDDRESIQATRRGGAIEILAEASAGGKLYKLIVYITVTTQEFRKFSRDEQGRKIQPYTSWVDLPAREQTQEFTVAVALGTLPHLLVPSGGQTNIRLSKSLGRLNVRPRQRPQAAVKIEAGNVLRILGKKPGKTKFELRYRLAGKSLTVPLTVSVLKEAPVVSLDVDVDGKAAVSIDEVDDLFELRDGGFLSIDRVEDAKIVRVTIDRYSIRVRGLRRGKTRAIVSYTGVEQKKGKSPQRFQTQVPLEITVRDGGN